MGRATEAKPHLDYFTSVQKQLNELDSLYDAIRRHPEDLEPQFRLGVLCLEIDSDAAGLFWLRGVLSRDPNHRATHAVLADFYLKKAAADPERSVLAEHHRRQSELPPNAASLRRN